MFAYLQGVFASKHDLILYELYDSHEIIACVDIPCEVKAYVIYDLVYFCKIYVCIYFNFNWRHIIARAMVDWMHSCESLNAWLLLLYGLMEAVRIWRCGRTAWTPCVHIVCDSWVQHVRRMDSCDNSVYDHSLCEHIACGIWIHVDAACVVTAHNICKVWRHVVLTLQNVANCMISC